MVQEIKGWHVFGVFAGAFSVIIAVNLTLAYNAVHSFPGLEVKNSYVASQSFDVDRKAQEALGWEVSATVTKGVLRVAVLREGEPQEPQVTSAVFGRATSVANDQTPAFVFDGQALVAPVVAGPGNWNLRLKLRDAEGTLFQQRVIVKVKE
ncbi:MAG: FixH family protein [Rhodobacterales bacterium]